MFNNNYSSFIDGTINTRFIEGDEHIFYKIRDFNKWSSIFPEDDDIKKTKFSVELLDEIFNSSWTFSKLTNKSKPHLIYRDMLEKIFCKKIIDSKTDKNKNTSFFTSENKRNLYDYCMEHLKLPTKCSI